MINEMMTFRLPYSEFTLLMTFANTTWEKSDIHAKRLVKLARGPSVPGDLPELFGFNSNKDSFSL